MRVAVTDLSRIPHELDLEAFTVRAIVETPKGSRSKYSYDPDTEVCELTGHLPAGMAFPLDFGFVPSTLGGDGDPLDILVVADEPIGIGTMVRVRILGIIGAEQRERDGRVVRNDRLLGRPVASITYDGATHINDLGQPFIDHLGRFFIQYNELRGKAFKVLSVAGPSAGLDAIRFASKVAER
jgi:inorganic pyrophosphatase